MKSAGALLELTALMVQLAGDPAVVRALRVEADAAARVVAGGFEEGDEEEEEGEEDEEDEAAEVSLNLLHLISHTFVSHYYCIEYLGKCCGVYYFVI